MFNCWYVSRKVCTLIDINKKCNRKSEAKKGKVRSETRSHCCITGQLIVKINCKTLFYFQFNSMNTQYYWAQIQINKDFNFQCFSFLNGKNKKYPTVNNRHKKYKYLDKVLSIARLRHKQQFSFPISLIANLFEKYWFVPRFFSPFKDQLKHQTN